MNKEAELRKYKRLATGLFIFMAFTYIAMLYAIHLQEASWMHYVKAFSEAAMVGALADWFAVTALFRYPMGLKIPHTNLIESNKGKIGANLGDFVTDNFLTPKTIRPYIEDLEVSKYISSWLGKPGTISMITNELIVIIENILKNVKEETVVTYVAAQIKENIPNVPYPSFVAKAVQYALDNKEQDKLIDAIIPEIQKYTIKNKQLIYERVVEKQPLLGLIGGKSVTNQLIKGLQSFLTEIEEDENHFIRKELEQKIWDWSEQLKEDPKWQNKFVKMVSDYMDPKTTEHYILNLWGYISSKLTAELADEQGGIRHYLQDSLSKFADDFEKDKEMQSKLNSWVQHSLYRLILKNTKELSGLIERTVGNWDGKELSEKLELEVGKDLQFIRVNGTLVGGLVGLLIYIVTHFVF
ncbi:MAG TPA: DUF445 domain-containing protein [Flavobacteriaceae bacterium]|nr:DUF445 domain-containing protein [Flavobacteriaceae bacterium]